ncbi:DNAJ domain protein [Orgyia pseudotsugata single capsid nuclopolyhedrovirus]|nr:DNAJ domain protein [Orgyia pseudotsugata single capsid nuclopolyhedrovirus]
MLRRSERQRRLSALRKPGAVVADTEDVLIDALQPSLKRKSRTPPDDINFHDDDDNGVVSTNTTQNKAPKMQLLYNVDLFTTDWYDIFQLKRYGNDEYAFKSTLAKSYDLLKRTYTAQLESEADANVNDYRTILKVVDLGYSVLSDDKAKRLYDNFLRLKTGEVYSTIVKRQQEFDAARRVVSDQLDKLSVLAANLRDNNIYAALLHNYFNEKISTDTQLRPSSFNRILVTWTVHPGNDNNENVTLELLLKYFQYYGPVNDAIMCTARSNCALLEFSSSAGVTAALSEKNKIYHITELNKWQINSATQSALKNAFHRLLELEAKAKITPALSFDDDNDNDDGASDNDVDII